MDIIMVFDLIRNDVNPIITILSVESLGPVSGCTNNDTCSKAAFNVRLVMLAFNDGRTFINTNIESRSYLLRTFNKERAF